MLRSLRSSDGFTLIEVLMVALIIGLLLGWSMLRGEPGVREPMFDHMEFAARKMSLEMAEAVSQAGHAQVFFGTDTDGRIWWSAFNVPLGDTVSAPPSGLKRHFDDRVGWGWGGATSGPLGMPLDAGLGPMPYSAVTCDAWRKCGLGDRVMVVWYVQEIGNPDAVAAVSLSRTGSVRAWRFSPENQSWY